MRRGIHLRKLRNRDLTVLGVAAGRVPEPESPAGHLSLLEVDPALGRRVEELRNELEEVLVILADALAAVGKEP
ncbi:MAG: hypothetical protein EOM92_04065 [Gammaproteobacteria bacterium]|jgi:hypothetical protein|nr:hypothetical protein [Gammaproteobacteria bacterium]